MANIAHHELPTSHVEAPRGSPRGFGFTFAVACAALGLHPLLAGGDVRRPLLVAAGALALLALARPAILTLPARLWLRFGERLQRVTGPVALGVVYFVVFTPTALVMRALGRDGLRLRREPARASYWIPRQAPRDAAWMRLQF